MWRALLELCLLTILTTYRGSVCSLIPHLQKRKIVKLRKREKGPITYSTKLPHHYLSLASLEPDVVEAPGF